MKKKPEVLAKAKIQLGRSAGPVLTPRLESPDWVNSPITDKALYTVHIIKGTPPDRLYQAWRRGEIELVTSTAQIAELADVLARSRLQRFLDADEARGCHRYDVHDGQC